MVYAVEPGGRIYWFHPHWPEGAPAPQAGRPSPARPSGRSCPRWPATRSRPSSLQVVALFAEQPLSASDVEAGLRSGQATFPGAVRLERPLRSARRGSRDRRRPAVAPRCCWRRRPRRRARRTRARCRRSPWCWGSTAASTRTARPCATPTTTPSASATCSRWSAMRTVALARLDDNTRRLAPGRAGAARPAPGRPCSRRWAGWPARWPPRERRGGGRCCTWCTPATARPRARARSQRVRHAGGRPPARRRSAGADHPAGGRRPQPRHRRRLPVVLRRAGPRVRAAASAAAARVLGPGADRRAARRGAAAVHLQRAREPRVGGVPGGRVQPRGALGAVRRRRRRRRRADHLLRDRLVRGAGQRLGPERAVPPRRVRQGARRRAGAAGPAAGAAPAHRGRRPGRWATTTWRIRRACAGPTSTTPPPSAWPARRARRCTCAGPATTASTCCPTARTSPAPRSWRCASPTWPGAGRPTICSARCSRCRSTPPRWRATDSKSSAGLPVPRDAETSRVGRPGVETRHRPRRPRAGLPRWRWGWWARARPRPSPGRRRCCRPGGCATASPPARPRTEVQRINQRIRSAQPLGRGPAGRRGAALLGGGVWWLLGPRSAGGHRGQPAMAWPPACADRSSF